MNRRDALMAAAAAAISPSILAADRVRRATSLQPIPSCEHTENVIVPDIRRAMKQLGIADIAFENHCFGNDFARARAIARDAIQRGTGVLVVGGTSTARAILEVTRSVPIIAIVGDPVTARFTHDLRRPEGNITGFSNTRPESPAKILDLARSVAPSFTRLVIVADVDYPDAAPLSKPMERAATAAKVASVTRLVKGSEVDALFAALRKGDVAYVEHGLMDKAALASASARHHIPTIVNDRDYVGKGGLMGYNVRTGNVSVRQAVMMDKLLKGTPVAEIPWELPDDIYLGINLKTAHALGLTIPADLRLRATQIIE